MTAHIVCLVDADDRYAPECASEDTVLRVPLDHPGDPDAIGTSLPDVLTAHGLRVTPAAEDLLRAAIGAYTADLRIPRRAAFDGWTRDFMLHVPVHETARWNTGVRYLETLLCFLTGDHWRIALRPARPASRLPEVKAARQPVRVETDTVCLFSGGLDSFIGALDALADREQVALVGHHAAGQGPTSVAQRQALTTLHALYSPQRAPFLKCWVSPPKGQQRASEITTRGRSILFLALGVAVASSLGPARVLVPENGFISLNVPLTPPRLGSLSTRTTHPQLLALLRELLAALGIAVTLELPYRFQTKGEMLVGAADQSGLARGLPTTTSCAHPAAARFVHGGSANQHCGYCLPCLVRRAAVAQWGPDPTTYGWTDLAAPLSATRGADLRALRLALERFSRRRPSLADLLRAGPLPGAPEEQTAYVEMYRRGIAEMSVFLQQFA